MITKTSFFVVKAIFVRMSFVVYCCNCIILWGG